MGKRFCMLTAAKLIAYGEKSNKIHFKILQKHFEKFESHFAEFLHREHLMNDMNVDC